MRYEIQGDISILSLRNVEYAYQSTFKAKEKIARKESQNGRWRSLSRGKGLKSSIRRFQASRAEGGSSSRQS